MDWLLGPPLSARMQELHQPVGQLARAKLPSLNMQSASQLPEALESQYLKLWPRGARCESVFLAGSG